MKQKKHLVERNCHWKDQAFATSVFTARTMLVLTSIPVAQVCKDKTTVTIRDSHNSRIPAPEQHELAARKSDRKPVFVFQVLPQAPLELVAELSRRYILLYEKITQQPFQPSPADEDPVQRISRNVKQALQQV